jgi:hypothetical protein
MSTGTKRTVEELITLHELEPELSEVITEGRCDAAVVLWFLRRSGSNAAVYAVSDRLDIPAGVLRKLGQMVGNKGRVVAAALLVSQLSELAASKISFIYDIDEDAIEDHPNMQIDLVDLLPTDYRSIELYAFNASTIDKLLKVALRAPEDIKAIEVLSALEEPLIEVAYLRFTLSRLERPVSLIETIERRCAVDGLALRVDIRALLVDSLGSAGGARALGVNADTLMEQLSAAVAASTLDPRLVIRGHDFTRICCYFLKQRYPNIFKDDRAPYKNSGVFENLLLTCLEHQELSEYQMFRRLLDRHLN